MGFVTGINFDVKGRTTQMMREYLNTTLNISEAYGKADEDVYIPGFGNVKGSEYFKLSVGNEVYSKISFEGAFSQVMKNYNALKDMEKQLQSSIS